MDINEATSLVKQQLISNYQSLSEEEKEIVRENKGTEYTRILKKIIPYGVYEGITSGPVKGIKTKKRGLASR
jgi:hypothetical protein